MMYRIQISYISMITGIKSDFDKYWLWIFITIQCLYKYIEILVDICLWTLRRFVSAHLFAVFLLWSKQRFPHFRHCYRRPPGNRRWRTAEDRSQSCPIPAPHTPAPHHPQHRSVGTAARLKGNPLSGSEQTWSVWISKYCKINNFKIVSIQY